VAVDPVTSALTADLERLYTQAERRLALIVRAGLNRGLDPTRLGTDRQRRGDSTLAYRERQRQQAEAILASLRARTTGATTGIVAGAYNAGVVTVDRTVGPDLRLRGEFGRVHVAAVEQLAGNLEQSLHAAADKVGEHIATVFDRAQAVEGALREGHNPATHVGVRFIGRRVDDAYRTATLEELAKATIGLDTRRQASAMLARRLVTDGLSDGLTALVDAGGRRWGLGEYAEMAARTTTAEAVSQGTLGRLEEGGLDLVAITSHPHQADVCTPFDGKTFSRSGTDARYPPLTSTPPFHPRCRHRLAPAATNLDDYEAKLAQAAREQQPAPTAAPAPARQTPGERVRARIEQERAGNLTDYIDRATASTVEQRARWRDLLARDEPGLGPIARFAVEHEDEVRRAVGAGEYAVPLDEARVRKIGREVAKLANRRGGRVRDLEKKIAELDKRRRQLAAELKTAASSDRFVELTRELRATNREATPLRGARRDAARDDFLDALRQVRPGYGEGQIRPTSQAGGDFTAELEEVAKLLPREWIERSQVEGPLDIVATEGRAYHRPTGANGSRIVVRTRDPSTLLHELGHRFQRLLGRDVRDAERGFVVRRTTHRGRRDELRPLSELVENSAYGPDERARGDKFTRAYIGKDYGGSDDGLEVLTMGLQGVFYGEHDVLFGGFFGEPNDLELRDLVLGLLSTA
jgi:hypothetical protein